MANGTLEGMKGSGVKKNGRKFLACLFVLAAFSQHQQHTALERWTQASAASRVGGNTALLRAFRPQTKLTESLIWSFFKPKKAEFFLTSK